MKQLSFTAEAPRQRRASAEFFEMMEQTEIAKQTEW
jgi:hypothetical protein